MTPRYTIYMCIAVFYRRGRVAVAFFYGIGDCGTRNPSPTIYMGNIYNREIRFFSCGTSRPETAPVKNPDATAVTSSRGA